MPSREYVQSARRDNLCVCQPRYAIYYTTFANHPLTVAAENWFGRSAFEQRGKNAAERPDAVIGEPRRYGFHATLKAPFRLAAGTSIEDLETDLDAFASTTRPCPIGRLRIGVLAGFFVPAQKILGVATFASRIVETFDCFRAPFDASELCRRDIGGLDEAETEQLVRWGYPYVFESFRFHMTLTNRIAEHQRPSLEAELRNHFGTIVDEDYAIDALTLFEQQNPEADFFVRRRFTLNPGVRF
ncbi:DUF1045 domain-containing protein [Rhizobium leguminosarum]|nr:DUF1045 domain-containing protein [Rhizobium leguminosarum]